MRIKKHSPQISWVAALSWIFGSTLLFSVVAHKIIRHHFSDKLRGENEEKIEYVVQTGLYKEALHSDCLMEVLELSSDRPEKFSSFDVVAAQRKLDNFPIIAKAVVKKIPPNMVYIDYSLRKPLFAVADFSNAVLDGEGALFPVRPFFSPKKLTEVRFGQDGLKESGALDFGAILKGRYVDLTFSLLEFLGSKGKDLFFVKTIDVSAAFSERLGKREVVLVLENDIHIAGQELPLVSTHYLRISPKDYCREIENYLQLREHLLEVEKEEAAILGVKILKEKTIDLRLSQLAFIR